MCGIVGVATSFSNGFSKNEVDVFQDMLFLDTMRGFDSTGIFGVNDLGNVGIAKEASHGLDFIRTKTFESFRSDILLRGVFAVGHNRAATRGEVVDKNAHPFWVDDKIVLVQNGTYRGDHSHLKNTDVDTEAVAHVISEEPDIEKALKKINASYALVWYNVETRTLNLIRNTERPLYLLTTNMGSLMWASEADFLTMACDRNNVKYKDFPVALPEYTLLQLELNDYGKWTKQETKLDCRYVGQHGNFPAGSSWGRWVSGKWVPNNDETPSGPTVIHLPYTKTNWTRKVEAVSPTQCDYTCNEVIADEFPDWHLTKEEAIAAVDACNQLTLKADREKDVFPGFMVELEDYKPANNHNNCTLWHVFGSFVCPPGSPEARVVVHWFLRDFTEREVMNYVADTFYMVDIISTKMASYNDKFSVVSVFAGNAQPVKQTTQYEVH